MKEILLKIDPIYGLYFVIIAVIFLPIIITKLLKITKQKRIIFLENVPIEFETIYSNLYRNHIHTLEKMRKSLQLRIIFAYSAIGIYILNLIFKEFGIIVLSEKIDEKLSFLILIIGLVFLSLVNKQKYKNLYKNEIVSKFIKLVNFDLEYENLLTNDHSIEDIYRQAEFDNKKFNRFHADDCITWPLNDNILVKMYDIRVQYYDYDGEKNREYKRFEGIFAFITCSKNVNSYVRISKNNLKIWNSNERTKIDNAEFEKYFDVYSENKEEVIQVMSPDFMQFLVDFYVKYGFDYEIVFKDNNIYIRFFTGAMFEPKIFGESMDKQLLFTYYCIVKFMVEVINEVNKVFHETKV